MMKVGLIGARGYVGRELIACLDVDKRFELTFASSRSLAGKPLRAAQGLSGLARFGDLVAQDWSPSALSDAPQADIYILGLPNGLAEPWVAAIDALAPQAMIVDLSADYRHKEGWVYGSPEIAGDALPGARRIANPGCYATAANLALYPLREVVTGTASVFGVSGYSGAGTTPGQRNDPERLESNIIPYGFSVHGHQREIAQTTALPIAFAPHVAPWFRGLLTTITVPVTCSASAIQDLLAAFYDQIPNVTVQSDPPEVAMVTGTDQCAIGGASVHAETGMLTVTSALDNLRKGAASQALENVVLATASQTKS